MFLHDNEAFEKIGQMLITRNHELIMHDHALLSILAEQTVRDGNILSTVAGKCQ